MNQKDMRLWKIVQEIEENGQFGSEREYMQHGTTSVYEHSIRVAIMSCRIAERFSIKVDYDSLVRGALLHDYFLYDWHKNESWHRLHGFSHPKTALKNAERDYVLNDIERSIIRCHMFPLTLFPPTTREAWIVCLADKECAFWETVEPFLRSETV